MLALRKPSTEKHWDFLASPSKLDLTYPAIGSPVARSPNTLDKAVDTSGAEAHAPQNMMESVDVSVSLLPCLRLSDAPGRFDTAVDENAAPYPMTRTYAGFASSARNE